MLGFQKTIKNPVACKGVGLHTGADVKIKLLPAICNSGIIFNRTDVKDKNPLVIANYKNVTNTRLGTTITNEDGISVATIEHLMAALWGCGVDNCIIEIDGPEVPIMDGSSEPFVFLVECAGLIEQEETRAIIEVLKPITVKEDNGLGSATIAPSNNFSVSIEINYEDKVVATQKADFYAREAGFKSELSRARTFGFVHEVDYLRSQGLARGGSLDNAIVVDKDGVLNEDGLRYDDEFVRHKILDCIGDIYLAGAYIKGHLTGFKSGHCLNNKLLHAFFNDHDAWRLIQSPVKTAAFV